MLTSNNARLLLGHTRIQWEESFSFFLGPGRKEFRQTTKLLLMTITASDSAIATQFTRFPLQTFITEEVLYTLMASDDHHGP